MNKEKTAMQKLIDYMRANFHLTESTEMEFSDSLLAERKQIEDAFDAGYEDSFVFSFADGEMYFNEKFENSVES